MWIFKANGRFQNLIYYGAVHIKNSRNKANCDQTWISRYQQKLAKRRLELFIEIPYTKQKE